MSHPFKFPCAQVKNENITSFPESLLARTAAVCGSSPKDTKNVPPVPRQSVSGGKEELPADFSIKREPADDVKSEASSTFEEPLDTRPVAVSMDITRKGEPRLVINRFKFTKAWKGNGEQVFWRCSRRDCGATAITNDGVLTRCRLSHTHPAPSQEDFSIKSPDRKRRNVAVQVSGNVDGISGPGGIFTVPQASGLADNQQPNLTRNETRENEGPDSVKDSLWKTLQASICDAMNILNSDTTSLADKNTALSIIKTSLDILAEKYIETFIDFF